MMNERLLVWLSLKVEDELLGDKAQDGVCMFLEWQDDFEDVPPEQLGSPFSLSCKTVEHGQDLDVSGR